MGRCVPQNCRNGNRMSSKENGITFHRFPNEKELQRRWVLHCGEKGSMLAAIQFSVAVTLQSRTLAARARLSASGQGWCPQYLTSQCFFKLLGICIWLMCQEMV
ncbi:uncharacterized protein LOC135221912 [Macrobrachium nipponense]|uniref:uncharacterized protein LOC135221912 n=1 Tax=Macrobrachium nipponense TaxID=159736 RepID=UPI0030C8CEBA